MMLKRAFDFTAALAGLLVLLPFFIPVALFIKFYDGGPVFFAQTRVGRGGKPFRMLKFRSMRVNPGGPSLTVGRDSRITPIGHVLRASKADELPQLWNVVCGAMSLVGPRPEVEAYVQHYNEEQREVLKLKPGITDPASFAFFNESDLLAKSADPERFYREQLMGEKIRINLAYARQAGFFSDLYLIFATIGKALGVHADVFRHFGIEEPKLGPH